MIKYETGGKRIIITVFVLSGNEPVVPGGKRYIKESIFEKF